MKTVAVRTIKRADADTTKALGHVGVSTVHKAQGRIGLIKTLYTTNLCWCKG